MMITGRHIAKAAKAQRSPALAAVILTIVYIVALVAFANKHSGEDPRRPDTYTNPG